MRIKTLYLLYAGVLLISSPAVCAIHGSDAGPLPPSNDSYLQDGKALYESGQYMPALAKFMSILRNDPTQPEARRYLRMVIDAVRQGPKKGAGAATSLSPVADDEVRRLLEKRSRLTLDLQAIPGVNVDITENASHIGITTEQLFADKTGGLREQGIPALDRISAWLGTFGQQPVIIHCYPEELQDPSTNGSLFLHRYSQLYRFFVQERHMSPQRFVSADLLVQEEARKTPSVVKSSSTAVVVFETVGSPTAYRGIASELPTHKTASWLEFSIFSQRSKSFSPEEGEWASLDLAALARDGVKSWKFVIVPTGKNKTPVFTQSGAGNLLQRLSWDGHNQATGSFVPTGTYLARLSATDAAGLQMTQELPVEVLRGSIGKVASAPERSPKRKRRHSSEKHSLSQHGTVVVRSGDRELAQKPQEKIPSTDAAAVAPPGVDSQTLAPATPPAVVPVPGGDESLINSVHAQPDTSSPEKAPVPRATDAGDASHTIWKQIIQFNSGKAELEPSVKSSLERIGKTLEVYPLQKVRIVGFATTAERGATALAKRRADTVRSVLVNDYKVDQKRVIVAGGQVSADEGATKVELSITN